MSVREQLVQLSELGLLDQKLRDQRSKQKSLPQKAESAKQKSDQMTEQENGLTSKIQELELKRRKLDGDLQNERTNMRKWESRADKIRGEREHTALVSEIGSLKRTISNLETEILEVMEAKETLEKDLAKLSKSAQGAREVETQEWDAVKEELGQVSDEIESLMKSRIHVVQKIDPMMLKRYEHIASKRAGTGLALVKREICQACSRMVPPELFQRVAKAEAVEQCPSCLRILVTEELMYAKEVQA